MKDLQDRGTGRYLNALPLVMTKKSKRIPPLRLDISLFDLFKTVAESLNVSL